MWFRYLVFVALLSVGSTVQAADFYIDPKTGADSNPGTQAKPWKSLQAVLDGKKIQTQGWASLPYKDGAALVDKNPGGVVKAGDTIWLASGYYGDITISDHYNQSPVTVAAVAGATPQLKSLLVRSSAGWHLKGLHVSPSFAPTYEKKNAVVIQSHSHRGPVRDVMLEGAQIFSVKDAVMKTWTADDWNAKAVNGIQVSGTRITLKNNVVRNINFGISVTATHSTIDGNTVENFAGDGLRGLGDHCVFQYNVVKNCYKVNSNHDDGFQSWSVGADGKVGTGVVKQVTLRGNTFINYTDPKQPMRCTLQGIGKFDGTFDGWVIENNVVIVDHWHGITLLGVTNSRVVNNTLMDPNNERPGPPWIMMGAHKNKTPPSGCLVRNNLTPDLNNADKGVTVDNNIEYKDAASFFVSPSTYDLHLLPNSPAIDKGSADQAPGLDRDKLPRPFGAAVDIGAYEWRDKTTPPEPTPSEPGPPDAGPADQSSQPEPTTKEQGAPDTPSPEAPAPDPSPRDATPDATTTPDTTATPDAPQTSDQAAMRGCGCHQASGHQWLWFALVLLLLPMLRRSRASLP